MIAIEELEGRMRASASRSASLVALAIAFTVACHAAPVVAAEHALTERQLTHLTVTDAARLIRAGRASSVALTRALLNKIRANRELKAFITLDAEGALDAAQRADQAREHCDACALGSLHGVPLVVK